MAYTPLNALVFSAAFSGAMAGIAASGRYSTSPTSADYDWLAETAGAYAQQFDTNYALAVNEMSLTCIEDLSCAAWQERLPLNTVLFKTPSSYATRVNAIIAMVQSSLDYYAAQGIPLPNAGAGGILLFATIAEMAAYDGSPIDDGDSQGVIAYVESVGDYFQCYQPGSAPAVTSDGIVYVDSTGVANTQWQRMMIPDDRFLDETIWYIDGEGTGDDENDGNSSLTPLATWAELDRRLGGNNRWLLHSTQIVLLSSPIQDLEGGRLALRCNMVGLDGETTPQLTITGALSQANTGTLTGAAATNQATNVQQTVTDTVGSPTWTQGQVIHLTVGDTYGVVGAQLSATQARTTDFMQYQSPFAKVTVVGNEAYETLDHAVIIEQNLSISGLFPSRIILEFLTFDADMELGVNQGYYRVCHLSDSQYNHLSSGHSVGADPYLLIYQSCWVDGAIGVITGSPTLAISLNGTLVTCPIMYVTGGAFIDQTAAGIYSEGTTWYFLAGAQIWSLAGYALSVWNAANEGINLFSGCFFFIDVMGDGNTTIGMTVARGAIYQYFNAPTITGGGDVTVAGDEYLWADLPFPIVGGTGVVSYAAASSETSERTQSGQATMVAGTVTVGSTAEKIWLGASSRIFVTPVGTSAADYGIVRVMGVTTGDPGTAAFVIQSGANTTASTLANDSRVVNWLIVD